MESGGQWEAGRWVCGRVSSARALERSTTHEKQLVVLDLQCID